MTYLDGLDGCSGSRSRSRAVNLDADEDLDGCSLSGGEASEPPEAWNPAELSIFVRLRAIFRIPN